MTGGQARTSMLGTRMMTLTHALVLLAAGTTAGS